VELSDISSKEMNDKQFKQLAPFARSCFNTVHVGCRISFSLLPFSSSAFMVFFASFGDRQCCLGRLLIPCLIPNVLHVSYTQLLPVYLRVAFNDTEYYIGKCDIWISRISPVSGQSIILPDCVRKDHCRTNLVALVI